MASLGPDPPFNAQAHVSLVTSPEGSTDPASSQISLGSHRCLPHSSVSRVPIVAGAGGRGGLRELSAQPCLWPLLLCFPSLGKSFGHISSALNCTHPTVLPPPPCGPWSLPPMTAASTL